MKRHGHNGQPDGHGHMMHRRTGAIGAGSTPARVWKNQKMPGHDGTVRRTTQNLKIVQVRQEDGVLLISGQFPATTVLTSPFARLLKRPQSSKP